MTYNATFFQDYVKLFLDMAVLFGPAMDGW